MTRHKRKKRELRTLAAPFIVSAPSGARIRDRLRLPGADAEVLTAVGEHLGHHARADLAARVRLGDVRPKDNQRASRKKRLTAASSSRWAGSITRASEDQYQLSKRALHDEQAMLRRAIRAITRRLAVPCGQREKSVRGYRDQDERFQKQRRLNVLAARLVEVERRIAQARPAIVVGGRRLVKTRHNLTDAELTESEWRNRWDAERQFLTADGETGAPYGNYTITVDPTCGSVSVVLPEPLRHLANSPRGRYRLSCTVTFSHRREEWLDRVQANRAVRYDIARDQQRGRWYLDASWSTDKPVPATPAELAGDDIRLLAVDLNADHLAACVVDAHGNPAGGPITIETDLTGPASQRDGRLRQAISELIACAEQNSCAGIAIEDLGFHDARTTGRESMGRGRRGKQFRRTVAGMPTAKFRERLRGMAYHRGLIVVAVDPAYTSQWGGQYWQRPLQQQSNSTVTRHHGASVAIGRRALGHGVRRRPGVTAHHQSDDARRATGQTVSTSGARGTASPPRTTGAPRNGDKTCWSRGEQLALFPDLEDRSRGHRITPVHGDAANTTHSPGTVVPNRCRTEYASAQPNPITPVKGQGGVGVPQSHDEAKAAHELEPGPFTERTVPPTTRDVIDLNKLAS